MIIAILGLTIVVLLFLWFACNVRSTNVSYSKTSYAKRDDGHDYIIVGAGTAGCTLAGKLARRGYSVLLIERGLNRSDSPIIQQAVRALEPAASNILSTTYLTEGIGEIRWPVISGRTVGGSSAVNYLVAVRPPRRFHERLVEMTGDSRFSYESFLEFYKDNESFIGQSQDPSQRGGRGPITITQLSGAGEQFGQWLSSVLGQSAVLDYNVGDDVVTSPYLQQTMTPEFIRSFAINYIYENGRLLDNITLLTDSQCDRIVFEKKRAVGCECSGRMYRAKKEVIVCSGIESSCILERSGIGNAELLRELDIELVHSNAKVGESLTNHGGGYLIFLMGKTYATQAYAPIFDAINSDGYRNVEHLFLNVNYSVPIEQPTPILTAAWNVDPKARGSIHIVSSSVQAPVIQFDNRQDIQVVAEYVVDKVLPNTVQGIPDDEQVGQLLNAPPLVGDREQRIATLAEWLYANQVPGQHYTGSCSIGDVVDSELRVIGVENLRVVDNSVYPTSVPGNTSISAYAIGLYAASLIGC